ncbi:MAG: ankyrin repeat domain-containing protein [Verrucomicrobia bacterium]|nr:ankyrin repeat domain-containing protein [Verrucomicrobiota bacterium]
MPPPVPVVRNAPLRLARLRRWLACASLGLALDAAEPPIPSPAPALLADAAERRDGSAVLSLIATAPVNAAQADGTTALHWAARHDDLAAVRALLAAHADPKARNRYGVTPLSLACASGSAAVVGLLLEAGADPNAALRGGETPLMTAARTGHLDTVQLLLSRGARVDDRLAAGGQTALMWAAHEGHAPVVAALIAAGADFRTAVDSGFTPLLFAARTGRTEVVRTLLRAGADLHEATKPARAAGRKGPRPGTSALVIAIENAHFELAAELLDRGADPNDLRSGYAPLHILSWVRKPDSGEDDGQPVPDGSGLYTSDALIRKLVACGADVNRRLTGGPKGGGRIARQGCTPFLLAADTADTPFLRLLHSLGADPTLTNVDACTPLMAAAGLGTRSVEEEAGTEDEACEAVEYLLSLGADPNAVSKNGDTAMHGAAFANFPKVVRLLDARGAKLEVWNTRNQRGWTPLLIAEGHRFGNFKPGFSTVAAFHELFRKYGLPIPPPTPRVDVAGYEDPG